MNRVKGGTVISITGGVIVGLSALFGAFVAHDARYALKDDVTSIKSDVRSLKSDFRQGQLENRSSFLRQYQFTLENERHRRTLSPIEEGRLQEITDELGRISEELAEIARSKTGR